MLVQERTEILDFLPLEIRENDISILLLNVIDENYEYYVVNESNSIPYNLPNMLAENIIDDFFKFFLHKSALAWYVNV